MGRKADRDAKIVDLPLGASAGRSCPICGKNAETRYHPFCSKRCADLDLGNWLSGGYAIAGAEDESEDLAGLDPESVEE